jgi:hypothetical protein
MQMQPQRLNASFFRVFVAIVSIFVCRADLVYHFHHKAPVRIRSAERIQPFSHKAVLPLAGREGVTRTLANDIFVGTERARMSDQACQKLQRAEKASQGSVHKASEYLRSDVLRDNNSGAFQKSSEAFQYFPSKKERVDLAKKGPARRLLAQNVARTLFCPNGELQEKTCILSLNGVCGERKRPCCQQTGYFGEGNSVSMILDAEGTIGSTLWRQAFQLISVVLNGQMHDQPICALHFNPRTDGKDQHWWFAEGETDCPHQSHDMGCFVQPQIVGGDADACELNLLPKALKTILRQNLFVRKDVDATGKDEEEEDDLIVDALELVHQAAFGELVRLRPKLHNHVSRTLSSATGEYIGMHVRRGDACRCSLQTCTGRMEGCYPLGHFVKQAWHLKQKYGVSRIYLATDSAETIAQTKNFSEFEWEYGHGPDKELLTKNHCESKSDKWSNEDCFIENINRTAEQAHAISYGAFKDLYTIGHAQYLVLSPSQFSQTAFRWNAAVHGGTVPLALMWGHGGWEGLTTAEFLWGFRGKPMRKLIKNFAEQLLH